MSEEIIETVAPLETPAPVASSAPVETPAPAPDSAATPAPEEITPVEQPVSDEQLPEEVPAEPVSDDAMMALTLRALPS
jgi:hypothetical protein